MFISRLSTLCPKLAHQFQCLYRAGTSMILSLKKNDCSFIPLTASGHIHSALSAYSPGALPENGIDNRTFSSVGNIIILTPERREWHSKIATEAL